MCDHHDNDNKDQPVQESALAEWEEPEWIKKLPHDEKGIAIFSGMHKVIKNRLKASNLPFAANDNISFVIRKGELLPLQEEVERCVADLLDTLIIDTLNDHNTKNTAHRVAKMLIHEIYGGRYKEPPKITTFPNTKNLDELYTTGPITVRSACSHHLVPIIGKCWIGVIPKEKLFGLSKFNRIVDWFCSRPQIQEELTVQIADFIENELKPVGLAVIIEASHMCMTLRGVKEEAGATMTTSVMRGKMLTVPPARQEFLELIKKGR